MKPLPISPMRKRRISGSQLQLGAGTEVGKVRAAERSVAGGMCNPRVLLRLLHQPAAVLRLAEDVEHALEVDDPVARRGEDAAQHRLGEADIALPARRQGIAANILAMDVHDA